jgi:hypothetical protein
MCVPFVEQNDGRANLAGLAVAALERVALEERLLHGVEPVAVRQFLDGGHL